MSLFIEHVTVASYIKAIIVVKAGCSILIKASIIQSIQNLQLIFSSVRRQKIYHSQYCLLSANSYESVFQKLMWTNVVVYLFIKKTKVTIKLIKSYSQLWNFRVAVKYFSDVTYFTWILSLIFFVLYSTSLLT